VSPTSSSARGICSERIRDVKRRRKSAFSCEHPKTPPQWKARYSFAKPVFAKTGKDFLK
jgi:hypothetical protein